MSLVLRLPRDMHLCRSSSNVPRLPAFLKLLQTLTFYALLARCRIPCACHAKPRPNFQKWSKTVSFFYTFHFQMCFRHLNFQKCSEHSVLCTFWLRNVLRATTACTFSTSQCPKVVRRWCVLYILTWKCASRHNGVHFFNVSTAKSGPTMVCFVHLTWKCASCHNDVQLFISHLARWLRTRRFSEPTFRPSGATNHWKNTVFRDFATFSRTCIFCLLTLSFLSSSFFFSSLLWLFSPLLFHVSILSEVWHLNFLRWKKMTIPSTSSTGSPCFQQVALFAPSSASLLRSSSKRTDSMVVT